MKKCILLLAAFMYVGLVWAQEPSIAPVVPMTDTETGGPIMTLHSDVVDYGNIAFGADPLRKITFKNTGDAPLIISNAKGSCGCTVPTWPRDPIMPGEAGEIEVRYDTKRPGAINKTIKITTNETVNSHTVRVIGNIAAEAPQEEALPKKEGIFNGGK